MFKFNKLTGLNLLWDNKLNDLLDYGKLLNVEYNNDYIWAIDIKFDNYLYRLRLDIGDKNIILMHRKGLIDKSLREGFKKTKISRKTYKKFLKKIPEWVAEYGLEEYKEVYQ